MGLRLTMNENLHRQLLLVCNSPWNVAAFLACELGLPDIVSELASMPVQDVRLISKNMSIKMDVQTQRSHQSIMVRFCSSGGW